jgi:hypothetical protein
MSTNARTITVHNPVRWFFAGVATTAVAGVLAAGMALSLLPVGQPAESATEAAPYVLLDAGLRVQRAGEIGADGGSSSVPGLTEQRKGEINEGGAGSSLPGLTEQRKGEINGGQ